MISRLLSSTSSCLVLILFLCFPAVSCFSELDMDIEADFTVKSGTDVIGNHDLFIIEGDLEWELEIDSWLECRLAIEADQYVIDTEEISIAWKPLSWIWAKIGTFDNVLTLDLYLPRYMALFSSRSLPSRSLTEAGFINDGPSLKLYRRYSERRHVFRASYYLSAKQTLYLQAWPQVSGAFLLHFNGPDSYLGFLGTLLPAMETKIDFVKQDSLDFAFNAVFADNSARFKYGIEGSLGMARFTSFSDGPLFLGINAWTGVSVPWISPNDWTISLRGGVIFKDVEDPDQVVWEAILGQRWEILDYLYFYFDGGAVVTHSFSESTVQLSPFISAALRIRPE